jgi:hypothetical protein
VRKTVEELLGAKEGEDEALQRYKQQLLGVAAAGGGKTDDPRRVLMALAPLTALAALAAAAAAASGFLTSGRKTCANSKSLSDLVSHRRATRPRGDAWACSLKGANTDLELTFR